MTRKQLESFQSVVFDVLAQWVKAINSFGGFVGWACDVAFTPGDVQDILTRLSNQTSRQAVTAGNPSAGFRGRAPKPPAGTAMRPVPYSDPT